MYTCCNTLANSSLVSFRFLRKVERYCVPSLSVAIATLDNERVRDRRRMRTKKAKTTGRLVRLGGTGSGCTGKMDLENGAIFKAGSDPWY